MLQITLIVLIMLIINTVCLYLMVNKSNKRLDELEKEMILQELENFKKNYNN